MIFKFNLFIGLLCVLAQSLLRAQNSSPFMDKELNKRYEARDTSGSKIIAVLMFFTDNTFINYGMAPNLNQSGLNIWFTAGRWLGNQEIIMCRTYIKTEEQEKLTNEIKAACKSKPEYLTYINDFSFLRIDYLDYVFSLNKKGLVDKARKLDYYEIK